MGKIKLLIKYIVYRLRRRGRRGHGIHSPFLFGFNRDVLNSSIQYQEYRKIDDYRKSLGIDKRSITVTDHGAGSAIFSSESRRVCDILRVSASSVKTGRLLFRLAKYLNPENTIEMGTSLGFGTMCLATGSPKGKIYSLEACANQLEVAGRYLGRAGVNNVELVRGDFSESLPRLMKKMHHIDLAYFDGDHRKESLLWQYNVCRDKATDSSIFVLGDIHWSPGMEEAWRIISSEPEVTLSVDLFWCGLLFFRKGMAKQHHILFS